MDLSLLPDHSRVWIYQSDREFTSEEVAEIDKLAKDFVAGWASHGNALVAGIDIRYNRFLIIAADEKQAIASGCSIDKSVHFVKALAHRFHTDLFDRMLVAYRQGERVEVATMQAFEQLLAEGVVNEDTLVFNNLVTDKAELMTKWEVPVKNSWHSRLLPV